MNKTFIIVASLMSMTIGAFTGSAEAQLAPQGSRINDTDRVGLAVKDADYTLTSKTQIIIYAAGVAPGNNDRVDDNKNHTWYFRRVGDVTWSTITTTSEVKLAATNALVHNTTVTDANRRATEGDPETFILNGKEFETANPLLTGARVTGEDGEITEAQIGLSFADALDNQQYEFAVEWENDGNTETVVYGAKITTPFGAALTVSSAANQTLTVGDSPTAASTLRVRDDTGTPTITDAKDLRIRIPSGFNMIWDTSVTTVTIGGAASGNVSGTLLPYEDAGKTAVVNVTSDFAAGDSITVSGLTFASFSATSAADNLELEVNDDGVVSATDGRTITIVDPLSLSSAGNQTFLIGDNATNMSIITLTEDGSPSITAANDIRIRIPTGLNLLWDAGTNATIGGSAASKVNSTVSYEDGGKTLVIAVNTDFAAGDQITIDKLKFTSFTALSSATSLDLIVGGAGGPVAASDDKTKTINDAPLKMESVGQKFYVGQPPMPISQITITDATSAPTITAAKDLRIRIPATFNMSWDTSDPTATIGGTAASRVSPSVSYEDGGKTLVLTVLTNFLAGEDVTVSDLSFASFTAASAKEPLELEVNDDGVVSAQDTKDKEILVGPSLSSAVNQTFNVGDPATLADTITITDSPVNKMIKKGDEIRIRIPAGFNMIWDATVTSVTIGGGAAGKMSTTLLPYEDANKTVVLNVTNDFTENDQITVVGLKFTSFSAVSAPDNLELEVTDDGMVIALDDKTIEIVGGVTYGVAVTPDTTTASRLPSNGTNYTVDFTVVNGGSGTDDFDLLTTQGPGTAITVVSITGTGVTQGANPDSARVSPLAAADTAIVTVTYSVADVAAGTADTLFFSARSVGDPATTDDGRLELTVVRPNLTTGKAVSPSGTQLPGTDLTYTVTITNDGNDDATGVVVSDSLAVELDFKVGSVVNNLPSGVSVTVEYSDDAGSTWTYLPASAGCGAPATYDRCVTHIRWTLLNDLSYVGPDNTGNVEFVARIQ